MKNQRGVFHKVLKDQEFYKVLIYLKNIIDYYRLVKKYIFLIKTRFKCKT